MGMPTIMPKVSLSRFNWRNSLIRMPSQRAKEKVEKRPISVPAATVLVALHEMDEGIFQ